MSLPFDLRALVAVRPDVLRAVHACFTRLVFGWLKNNPGWWVATRRTRGV